MNEFINTYLRKFKLIFGRKKSAANNTGIYVDMKQKNNVSQLHTMDVEQNQYVYIYEVLMKQRNGQLNC